MGVASLNMAWPAWRTLEAWLADADAILRDDAKAMAEVAETHPVPGACGLCGANDGFRNDSSAPGLREGLECGSCRCNARQRAAAAVLFEALRSVDEDATPAVYATEQASPLFVALRRRLPGLHGSEYAPRLGRRIRLAAWLLRRGVAQWVQRQDVTALGFQNASRDAIISLDVLEHVPDYRRALQEFARVLRPGGTLVLTVPFYADRYASAVIASVRPDGGVEHIGMPEFHGDPLSGAVPCFHHFAWDLLQAMREAGFGDAKACRVRDTARGLPQGQWVFRARR